MTFIAYKLPASWVKYNLLEIVPELTEAKAAVMSLKSVPFQKSWGDSLQDIQLKREVAGTSRIEGAEFTERELDAALKESPDQLRTRSQRQAAAAVSTYRWIAKLEDDRPISSELIREVHARLVTGADDDHCEPGVLRKKDNNVTFGVPKHRGATGGEENEKAFEQLSQAVQKEFLDHDPLVQALALHYHFAAIHPFLDGNGRTARALEALVLQRKGLRDTLFIAMSNYYYDEKVAYLESLSAVRGSDHDLTKFLKFGLKGIALQCSRLFEEIKQHLQKALFRNQMTYLFGRLQTKKKRVIAERQFIILNQLLENEELDLDELITKTESPYDRVENPRKVFFRDLNNLIALGAVTYRKTEKHRYQMSAKLEWASEITETSFFAKVKQMPTAKNYFLS